MEKKNGPGKEYDEKGELLFEGEFLDGKKLNEKKVNEINDKKESILMTKQEFERPIIQKEIIPVISKRIQPVINKEIKPITQKEIDQMNDLHVKIMPIKITPIEIRFEKPKMQQMNTLNNREYFFINNNPINNNNINQNDNYKSNLDEEIINLKNELFNKNQIIEQKNIQINEL